MKLQRAAEDMAEMSDQEFEAHWKTNQRNRLSDTANVVGKWDQADATLMVESGWTQERIAEKIGMSRQRVTQLLTFGRFIATTGSNGQESASTPPIPTNLSERAFREVWSLTKPAKGVKLPEDERFDSVWSILEKRYQLEPLWMTARSTERSKIASKVIPKLAGEEYWTYSDALGELDGLGIDLDQLKKCVANIKQANTGGYRVKEKRVKGETLFQISRLGTKPLVKSQKVIHFYEEAKPLLKEAKGLTDRDITTVSMKSILHKLVLLERLVEGLHDDVVNE